MPNNARISELPADTNPASNDLMVTVDVSDTTDAPTGTSKKVTTADLTKALSVVVGDSGSGGTKGLIPAPAAGDAAAGKFLKADGTFAVPSGSGYATVEDEGSAVTQRSTVNFTGAGVSVVDSGGKTVVSVPGGGGVIPDPLGTLMQVQSFRTGGGSSFIGISSTNTSGSNGAAPEADGMFESWTSATTLDADAGRGPSDSTADMTQTRYLPIFYFKGKSGSNITEHRMFVGLTSNGGLNQGTDTPASHYIGFRHSTAAGDTNIQVVSDDGGSAPTVTDSGVVFAADTVYTFKIDCADPASVKCYINEALVATHTTNLPATSTSVGWWAKVRNLGATNAKVLKINRMVLSMR